MTRTLFFQMYDRDSGQSVPVNTHEVEVGVFGTRVTLGRDGMQNIRVQHREISRQHGVFKVDWIGNLSYNHLGQHPAFIVLPGRNQVVERGQSINLGKFKLGLMHQIEIGPTYNKIQRRYLLTVECKT